MSEGYNGWKNRETWLINLWFGDDEYLKEQVQERDEHGAVKFLENYIDEYMEEFSAKGFIGDLMSGAVARIDFYDIVKTWKID
jgi:hypothetical protein